VRGDGCGQWKDISATSHIGEGCIARIRGMMDRIMCRDAAGSPYAIACVAEGRSCRAVVALSQACRAPKLLHEAEKVIRLLAYLALAVIPDAPEVTSQSGTRARSGTHVEICRVLEWVPARRAALPVTTHHRRLAGRAWPG